MSRNTLLVKLSSMGDVVHSFPALTEAASYGHRFDWVVEEAFTQLAAMHPAVDRVIPFGLRRWRRQGASGLMSLVRFARDLRADNYSTVLDAQGLLKSALVSRVSGAERRFGLAQDSAREPMGARFYTHKTSVSWDQHAIDRLRLLFSKVLGYDIDLTTPVASPFSAVAGDAQETIIVHGTTWRSKEYPEVMWRQLLQQLAAADHIVVLLSGSDVEYQRAQRLRDSLGDTVQAAKPGTLLAAAERVRQARLVIGVDSGLTHLGAVLGRPTVGLYGSTSAIKTGVRGPFTLDLASDFGCAPCLRRECSYTGEIPRVHNEPVTPACFAKLNPHRVLAAAEKLLAQQPKRPVGSGDAS